ncbi:hypothetical protein PSTG_11590 [Puccinia striiformis f. sp. tritici PST-78]|uniref:Uncharacterized protein n=1 Tax=Puccinia striiformis f. sp. tritici PST-78 TaxID=1165861 RepID=A0A0L0V762_9BASI|nr:hypothetical protein PSTG_11590 [Puccinia striiformis f. sp. tritici PST-78]
MERSDPHGSPLAKKRPANQRKFAKEVYKPSNRLLPPNKRLWGSENVNDVSEDTASSKEIQQAPTLKKGKSKVKEESESKAKEKPGRKIASKPVKLSDKSNAQKEVVPRTSGRVTRSSAMTNSRAGRSKMDVLDEEEEEVIRGPKKVRGEKRLVEDEEEHDNFLDVSADHRIHPFFRTNQPTQQSLGADVTLTFDVDRHARALAGCSPIPRIAVDEAVEGRNITSAGGSNPTRQLVQHSPSPPPAARVVKNTRAKLKISQPPSEPSPPKKRARRQPATTKSLKSKASKAPLSDDPLMI